MKGRGGGKNPQKKASLARETRWWKAKSEARPKSKIKKICSGAWVGETRGGGKDGRGGRPGRKETRKGGVKLRRGEPSFIKKRGEEERSTRCREKLPRSRRKELLREN